LAGRRQHADAIEARAVLAEVDGESSLREIAAGGVPPFYLYAEHFGDTRLFARAAPEAWHGSSEGESNTRFALGIALEIGDTHLLFGAGELVNEMDGVADGEFGLKNDHGAAGVHDNGFGFFLERAGRSAEPVDDYGNVDSHARAGARDLLCDRRGGGECICRLRRRGWRGIVEGSDFEKFYRRAFLRTVFAATEFPLLFEDLFEGFFAIGEREPTRGVATRANEASAEGSSGSGFCHENTVSC